MDQKGFFQSLTDFSFSSFITKKLIGVLYGIEMVLVAIAVLGLIVMGFKQGIVTGLLLVILSPILLVLSVIAVRVYFEMIVIAFRIEENTSIMAKNMTGSSAGPAPNTSEPPPAQ